MHDSERSRAATYIPVAVLGFVEGTKTAPEPVHLVSTGG